MALHLFLQDLMAHHEATPSKTKLVFDNPQASPLDYARTNGHRNGRELHLTSVRSSESLGKQCRWSANRLPTVRPSRLRESASDTAINTRSFLDRDKTQYPCSGERNSTWHAETTLPNIQEDILKDSKESYFLLHAKPPKIPLRRGGRGEGAYW